MSIIPMLIPVMRMHARRADEDDARRAARATRYAPADPADRAPSLVELANRHARQVRPDLVGMLSQVGVSVGHAEMPDRVAGRIDAGRRMFLLNARHSATRRRFTLAHQIGHWIWHRPILEEHGGTNDDTHSRSVAGEPFHNPLMTEAEETFANKCAISLIMSEDVVRRLHAEGLDPAGAARLTETTTAMMEIRFRSLGLETRI